MKWVGTAGLVLAASLLTGLFDLSSLAGLAPLRAAVAPIFAGVFSLRAPVAALAAAAESFEGAMASLPEDVRRHLTGTLYLSVPMALVGTIGGLLYQAVTLCRSRFSFLVQKHCQVSLVFDNSDKHYDSIIDYIGSKCAVETGTLLASTTPRTRPSYSEMLSSWLGGKAKVPTLHYQPDIQALLSFFFWTDQAGKKHKIWLSRHVERPQIRSEKSGNRKDPERLVLTVWWTTDNSILKEFMAAALQTMLRDTSDGLVDIYVKHEWAPIWTKAVSREKRDRATVVLDEDLADYVVEDMRHFFSKKTADWYHNAGIPYRRGYLLFGPPGCGKTSFAQVLAGELGLDVCLMNLSNQSLNDDDLASLLRAAPTRSMLLLEDVDSIFVERAAGKDKKAGGVSFSGLLNALDGAAAQEGCIILMTTNHKERLDEALIRPGRCDVHVRIDKATQDQARRMFNRFFASELEIASTDGAGLVTSTQVHCLASGSLVRYHRGSGAQLLRGGYGVEERAEFFVHIPSSEGSGTVARQLRLYDAQGAAARGAAEGLATVSGGKGGKLQEQMESAVRFSQRIPDCQVSMAKLQAYLMKQKLLAEQALTKRRQRDELHPELAASDPSSEEHRVRYTMEVHRLAADTAVMNVHELLDVKTEAAEVPLPIYDHLRRVGLHQFAPLCENFGIRLKSDVRRELLDMLAESHPELKVKGPTKQRITELFEGAETLDKDYALADLSLLRDRFLAAYQNSIEEPTHSSAAAGLQMPKAPVPLERASSEPASILHGGRRHMLLKMGSARLNRPGTLELLEFAHEFQERLERNGRTDVSIWQLDIHFQRYAEDPVGAVENCGKLCHLDADRSPSECAVEWVSTFAFLRRLGLEEHAFSLEDQGFKFWNDWKHLSKDEIKEKGEMSAEAALFCHTVLQGNSDRPDLLRKFQTPLFADIVGFFRTRFPEEPAATARRFARELTDELGVATVSCLQVTRYLSAAKDPQDAFSGLVLKLPPSHIAAALRERPAVPPPPPKPETWVRKWLEAADLGEHADGFANENLTTRELVLAAPLKHEVLKDMGVNKIGDRCRILELLEKERGAPP